MVNDFSGNFALHIFVCSFTTDAYIIVLENWNQLCSFFCTGTVIEKLLVSEATLSNLKTILFKDEEIRSVKLKLTIQGRIKNLLFYFFKILSFTKPWLKQCPK